MNKLNIEDQVKINIPGTAADGKVVKVTSMQQLKDGKILYVGTYHEECPNDGEGFDATVQFGEGEYEIIKHVGNGAAAKSLGKYSITVKLEGLENVKGQLKEIEDFIDRLLDNKNQLEA